MELADQIEFVKTLNGLAAMKPGAKLTKESIALFWESMRADWTLAEFKAAANHLAKAHEFMPNPFHFEQLRRAGEPRAPEAWALAFASCVNWRAGPLPTGRIARAAEAVGGFRAIAMADAERDLPHVQRRFLEAYNELTDVDPVREALPQIAAEGARRALTAPTNIAALLPAELTKRSPQPALVALPAPAVATTVPKVALPPPKSARDKILALLPLAMDDDAIAKVSRESIELVRQVRAEQEQAA